MFKRNHKIEVVPENMYTDYSHRDPSLSDVYATRKTVIAASAIPAAVSVGLLINRLTEPTTTATIPVTAPVNPPSSIIEPINVITTPTIAPIDLTSPDVIATGFIADKSLETLANVLDPLVQIMMAISFPIASVILIGGSFFFLLGNSEKAWGTIFNAALGYIIIQMSPLFLEILRTIGESV